MEPLDLPIQPFFKPASVTYDVDLPGSTRGVIESRVWLRADLLAFVIRRVSTRWPGRKDLVDVGGYCTIVFSVAQPAWPLWYPTQWDRTSRLSSRTGLESPGWVRTPSKAVKRAYAATTDLRLAFPQAASSLIARLSPADGLRYLRAAAPVFSCHWHESVLVTPEHVGSPGTYNRPLALAGHPVTSAEIWILSPTSGVWVFRTAHTHRLVIILPSISPLVRPRRAASEWIAGQPTPESVRAWFDAKLVLLGRSAIYSPAIFDLPCGNITYSDYVLRGLQFEAPEQFLAHLPSDGGVAEAPACPAPKGMDDGAASPEAPPE